MAAILRRENALLDALLAGIVLFHQTFTGHDRDDG